MKFTLTRPSTGSIVLFVFAAGMLAQSVINRVGAHGGDPNLIHTCVKTSNGSFRFVGENELCNSNETAVDWPKTGGSGIGAFGGFVTDQLVDREVFEDYSYRYFSGGNFSNSKFNSVSMFRANFSNANFTSSTFDQINYIGGNFSNSNFTNASFDATTGGLSDMTDANFTNANFTNATFRPTSGSSSVINTNFTNANFTGADLTGVNFENSTRTGVIWSNTTCPDGTNSDANGNTCEGHLVP